MKQSRAMSLVEAVANVVVGCGVAVVTQILATSHAELSATEQLAALGGEPASTRWQAPDGAHTAASTPSPRQETGVDLGL